MGSIMQISEQKIFKNNPPRILIFVVTLVVSAWPEKWKKILFENEGGIEIQWGKERIRLWNA